MKTISELSNLEANQRLTELRGGCWHKSPVKGGYQDVCTKCHYVNPNLKNENKPYATSYNDIIPAIQDISEKYDVAFSSWLKATPRELLNAAIEVLEQHEHDN